MCVCVCVCVCQVRIQKSRVRILWAYPSSDITVPDQISREQIWLVESSGLDQSSCWATARLTCRDLSRDWDVGQIRGVVSRFGFAERSQVDQIGECGLDQSSLLRGVEWIRLASVDQIREVVGIRLEETLSDSTSREWIRGEESSGLDWRVWIRLEKLWGLDQRRHYQIHLQTCPMH